MIYRYQIQYQILLKSYIIRFQHCHPAIKTIMSNLTIKTTIRFTTATSNEIVSIIIPYSQSRLKTLASTFFMMVQLYCILT